MPYKPQFYVWFINVKIMYMENGTISLLSSVLPSLHKGAFKSNDMNFYLSVKSFPEVLGR